MKLIHLSDLHLGKRVHEVSMLPEQEAILPQILQIVDEEQADAVLLAGDIYDRTVPSAEAVNLLDRFLWELSQRQVPVLMISGNHDSPERLAFAGRLLERSGIHISPVYDGQVEPVTLTDEHGPVDFWLLPFLKPLHVKRFYPDEGIETYTDACRVAVEKLGLDPTRRNVLLAHQFVTGGTTCESEEISVGGSDNVDAAVFNPFDYVALGHLHGPQNLGSHRIRYCGTPLKYSFSEEHHHKSVTVVDLGPKGDLTLSLRPLHPRHDLRSIRGTFATLTAPAFYENTTADDYLHVILTDEEDVPEALGKLRQIYPHLLRLSYDNTRTQADQCIDSAEDIEHRSPLDLFEALYQLQNNQPMSDEQRRFTQELIGSIWEESL